MDLLNSLRKHLSVNYELSIKSISQVNPLHLVWLVVAVDQTFICKIFDLSTKAAILIEDEANLLAFLFNQNIGVSEIIETKNSRQVTLFSNDEIYFDLEAFQVKLTEYLNWYNNKRPHASLGYLSPNAVY